MTTKEQRLGYRKDGTAIGTDDATKAAIAGRENDRRFQNAMLAAHGEKYGVNTEPSTHCPRFVGLRSLPRSRSGSPGALCAEMAGNLQDDLTGYR